MTRRNGQIQTQPQEDAMSTTNDEPTGLPQLPEGEYWRVRKAKKNWLDLQFGIPTPPPSEPYELCIYKTVTRETRTPRKWLGIVTGYETGTETVELEIDGQGIKAKRPQPSNETWQTGPEDSPDTRFYKTCDVTLTPQSIRETAERMLALRSERQRVKSLLGDYPPKKLADQ